MKSFSSARVKRNVRLAGLYIHIPFCRRKCNYCSFVSSPASRETIARYFRALEREMLLYSADSLVSSLVFDTIYLGGGTPSIVPKGFIRRILDAAREAFQLASNDSVEVSMECNPDSVSLEMVGDVRTGGVNRVSLGVQSMDEGELGFLGRIHGTREILSAVSHVRRAGIQNLSMDIIYALPGQSTQGLLSVLEKVLALRPDHLSCYELTLEEGTPLEKAAQQGLFSFPGQEKRLELTRLLESVLRENGFGQYEISNFSLPGFECRHNMGYWTGVDYLGVGCSACSFLGGIRIRNESDTRRYMGLLEEGKFPVAEVEELGREARFREAVVMALRMNQGILLDDFSERYGMDVRKYYGHRLDYLEENGLVRLDQDHRALVLTARGRYIANHVLSHLV